MEEYEDMESNRVLRDRRNRDRRNHGGAGTRRNEQKAADSWFVRPAN